MNRKNGAKVVIISSTDMQRGGGVASHIDSLCRYCRHLGMQVVISINTATFGVRRLLWVLLVSFPAESLVWLSKGYRWLIRLILADIVLSARALLLALLYRPDCINFHGGGNILFWKLSQHLPIRPKIVLTVHGYLLYEALMNHRVHPCDRRSKRNLLRLERAMYLSADAVICVDSRLGRYVSRISGRQVKPIIIPNAVELPKVKRSPEFGTILCPRMLTRKNGVEYAIRAMKYLPYLRLIVAGDGPERPYLEGIIKSERLNNVVLLGWVNKSRMTELYSKAHIVVIPSCSVTGVQEATSISALEAMSYGIPVIATAVGGLREIFNDGVNGLLIPERSIQAIVSAVNRLIDDPTFAENLGRQAYETVKARFSMSTWGNKYAEVLLTKAGLQNCV